MGQNLRVPRSPTETPHQVACGERHIYLRGVFGDGEDCESGDEKNREIRYTYRHRL